MFPLFDGDRVSLTEGMLYACVDKSALENGIKQIFMLVAWFKMLPRLVQFLCYGTFINKFAVFTLGCSSVTTSVLA